MKEYSTLAVFGLLFIGLFMWRLHIQKEKMYLLEVLEHKDKLSEVDLLSLWPDKTLAQLRNCAQSLSEQNLIAIVPKVGDPSNLGSSWDLKITAKGLDHLLEDRASRGIVD